MSFMFKPLAYNDASAINYPEFNKDYTQHITVGNMNVGKKLANEIDTIVKDKGKAIILIDGYASANTDIVTNLIHQYSKENCICMCNMKDLYKTKAELDKQLVKNLPPANEEDPIELFGYIFEGEIQDLFDAMKYQQILDTLEKHSAGVFIVYGQGAANAVFRNYADKVVYLDVTPKETAIRTRNGEYTNIGDSLARNFSSFMRRNYFVDFEVMVKLRRQLLQEDSIDFYIFANEENNLQMVERETFNEILLAVCSYPFRCKPVYLEGIWGGEYIRKVRNLDIPAQKIAWIFEMIPMEVSIVVSVGKQLLEFPFCTFFQKFPNKIMGEACTKRFHSYFPIRCNYDDTYHSDGNMSIQVHPNEGFVKKHYNDMGSQDEAYYVIATGHGAKTYAGVCNRNTMKDFFALTKKSLNDGSIVDYKQFVNGFESTPGKQFMIPGGTIHASGQNQFILELGSLTIGSYTYKIYDYLRKDNDGNRRPIHLVNGINQVDTTRDYDWVKENLAFDPILIKEEDGCREELLGKTDLMYYETSRYCIETGKKAEGSNDGQFTILSIVDGESVCIYDKRNPLHCYKANYLDIIIVPAEIDTYVIENTGYQPIVVHKVILSK